MSCYAWKITKDKLTPDPTDRYHSVGVTGPRDARDDLLALLNGRNRSDDIEVKTFRILDDDRLVYYHGRIAIDWAAYESDPGYTGEPEFGPLDDYGTPNDGATIIQYRDEHGKWADL